MALLKCPDCGHNVSDQAETCPECGYPVSKINKVYPKQKEIMCKTCGRVIETVSGVCGYCGTFPGQTHGYTPTEKWYKCPKCDKLVGAKESICKNCGEHVSLSELSEQDKAKLKKRESDLATSGIMGFVFLVLILCGGLYFIGAFDSPHKFKPAPATSTAPRPPSTGTAGEAYSFAKHFVQERLKAPRSAKFPGMSEAQIRKVDGTFIVRSYVDSQNAFGAMIRTYYRAKVMYLGNLEWKLLDLQTE